MPFIPIHIQQQDFTIGIWKVEEDEQYFKSRLCLYENELRKLANISHPTKRLEYLSSRLCLKELLKIRHKVESLNLSSGKPYLSDHSYNISYTHTLQYSAAIASKLENVAIDAEYLPKKRNMNTRRLFMNPMEMDFFEKHPDRMLFFLIWSAKETLYKIQSEKGISLRQHISLDLNNFSFDQNGTLTGIVQKNDVQTHYEVSYHIFADLLLTYTSYRLQKAEGKGRRASKRITIERGCIAG